MDIPVERLKSFVGRSAIELPTPSLVLNQNVIRDNCETVLRIVKDMKLDFRAHVKTLKVSCLLRRLIERSWR